MNASAIYQIILPHDVSDNNVAAIKRIGCFSVRVEKMKPSAIIQCHRCQRYAHTAARCAHVYRCVQCVNAHMPGCCPRSTNKGILLGCVNCKAAGLTFEGHTANDSRVCGFYLKSLNANRASPKSAAKTSTNYIQRSSQPIATNDIIENVRANDPTTEIRILLVYQTVLVEKGT